METDNAFKSVNRIALEAGRRAESDGLQSLSEPEQTVMLIWWAVGIIQNGGFQYFYEGASEMADVAAAFDRIDAPEAAQACRTSMTVFPDNRPPDSFDERWVYMEQHAGIHDDFFEPLNELIWDVADADLEGRLQAYIQANRPLFRDTEL